MFTVSKFNTELSKVDIHPPCVVELLFEHEELTMVQKLCSNEIAPPE